MTTLSTAERMTFADSLRRQLAQNCSETDLRRIMAGDAGHDPALWSSMAGLGVTGLVIDPGHGGTGTGPVELEMAMEVAGAALCPGPLIDSIVLAPALLMQADDETKERVLPGLAAGECLAAVVLGEQAGDGATVSADAAGRLSGIAPYVHFANVADVLLVVAGTAHGPAMFEVAPDAPGLAITPLKCWDPTRRLARVDFDNVPARRIGCDNTGEAVARAVKLARVALAGEQAGAARHAFDLTMDYLKMRVQFGRPIGGFQAVKHIAADLLLDLESSTSAARAAARALSEGADDADLLIDLASFTCADVFSQISATAIQLFGGIAFTWEHTAHLYWRRAKADAQLFGGADASRERYVSTLEAMA